MMDRVFRPQFEKFIPQVLAGLRTGGQVNREPYLALLRKLMVPWNLGNAPVVGYTRYCELLLK